MSKGLPPEEIVWRIEKALAIDGTHTWGDVVASLQSGECQIFWNNHGAWITKIVQAPRKRTLHCWIVAGELPEVMELQTQVENHARVNGCEKITATSRLGWKHVAHAHGWKQEAALISIEVDHA
jgi:hypothetical protein